MKKTRIVLTLMGAVLLLNVNAQIEKVPNPNFDIEKKVKEPGQIDLATGWYSPEGTDPADLFSSDAKKEEVSIPVSQRGRAETVKGNQYAGITAYYERNTKPRTYIQTKMEKKLLAGKKYCVSMHLQLSDLSKYAVNGVGMHLGSKAIRLKDIEEYDLTPQLTFHENGVVEEQFEWVKICRLYEADGTERYITIGNFAPESAVQIKKVRRPREFKQPQTRDAYYFIDGVSIIAMDHLESPCDCTPVDDSPQFDVSYTKNVSEGIEGTTQEKIEHIIVHFNNASKSLSEEDKGKVDEVIALMNEDSSLRIELQGHNASNEDMGLGDERAKAVFVYMTTEKGVDANRVDYKGYGFDMPKSEEANAAAHAQNRRVEFKVK
jgi:outer membrane protein OmpA-like peptidoglycan-associated protein